MSPLCGSRRKFVSAAGSHNGRAARGPPGRHCANQLPGSPAHQRRALCWVQDSVQRRCEGAHVPIPFDVRTARWDWADENRRTSRGFRNTWPGLRGVSGSGGFYGRLVREDAIFPRTEPRWVEAFAPGKTALAALAASARTADTCIMDRRSPTGVAHRSAMRSSASREGRSNISSTERVERSTPSRHSASFCVKRTNIFHPRPQTPSV